jgi:hypothetical protein
MARKVTYRIALYGSSNPHIRPIRVLQRGLSRDEAARAYATMEHPRGRFLSMELEPHCMKAAVREASRKAERRNVL